MNTFKLSFIPRHLLGCGILVCAAVPGLLTAGTWTFLHITTAIQLSYLASICGLVTGTSALTAIETGLLMVGVPGVFWLLYIRSGWCIKEVLRLAEGKELRCFPGYNAVYDDCGIAGWIHNATHKDHVYIGPGSVEFIASKSLAIRCRREKLWFAGFVLAGPIQCLALSTIYMRYCRREGLELGFGWHAMSAHRPYGLAIASVIIATALPLLIMTTAKHARTVWWPRAGQQDYAPLLTWLPVYTIIFSNVSFDMANSVFEEAVHSVFAILAATAGTWAVWRLLPKKECCAATSF